MTRAADAPVGFHVVARLHRDTPYRRVFNGESEEAAREAYKAAVSQATRTVGAAVQLRDRVGRVLASYLAEKYDDDTPRDRRGSTGDRRAAPRPTTPKDRRHR